MLVLAVLLCASILVGNRAVRIATYNTALTSGLKHYKYRAENAPSAISKINTDFVCLQEVWYMEDALAIVEKTKDIFPYSFSFNHDDVNSINSSLTVTAACRDPLKVAGALECGKEKCGMHSRSEILSCVNKVCSKFVEDLNQNCISCLVMAGRDNYKMCLKRAFNLPGLLILSKRPLVNPYKRLYFPGTLLYLPRGYLQTDLPDIGRIVCTHLTGNFGPNYFERLNFTSHEEQQKNEIEQVITNLDAAKDGKQKAVIVTGDLNTGPEVLSAGVSSDLPSNYELFLENGFQDSYITQGGDCTWCVNNPLTEYNTNNHIYDHVLVKGAAYGISSKKIMTEELSDGAFPISDHYGVMVDVQIKSYWRMLSEYVLGWIYSAYNSAKAVL